MFNVERSSINTKIGQTLRERLLGPTTGKPFVYGTYALAGASAFGIGLMCYYGLYGSQLDSAAFNMTIWPEYVRSRLQLTYGYFGSSLLATATSAVMASRSPTIMNLMSTGRVFLLTMAAIVGSGMITRAINYDNTLMKHIAWLFHAGIMGAMLAPLCILGGPALIRAAWYTAGLTGGLSLIAFSAPSEKFLKMYGPLAMGLGIVFVANIGTFFFPPGTALGASLASIVVYGGLILFSAFLLHDTQRVVKLAESYPVVLKNQFNYDYEIMRRFDPINAQMSIYLDVLNIFIRMAMIIGGGGARRK
ncbi:unnamed protein product [Dracunculus medinensis]|uniref:Growth hormone-inducible transmembrane protein n=1 Tax=Dracunculus medinensis TaxID=318479 RepID=A0A3P7SF62_DRAME|nr:unnamed protein product [Dracunculus medinensis]